MQQDAHEFLNFLINHINEIILCKFTYYISYFFLFFTSKLSLFDINMCGK